MRIDLRVAVSGEVFGCADDAAVFHTFDVGQAFGSYVFRVFTEGTVTDHGIECIVVYVHRRCQVDVQSGAFGLAGDFQSHFIDQVVVLERTQRHLIREAGYVVQTHSQAPFAVDGDEHRGLGGLLQAVGQCSGFGKGAFEEHGTAHAQVLRIVECLDDGRRVAGTQLDKDHLSDLFFQGQGVEYRIHPGTVHVLDELRIFILGVHGEQAHHKGEKQKESFHPVKMVFCGYLVDRYLLVFLWKENAGRPVGLPAKKQVKEAIIFHMGKPRQGILQQVGRKCCGFSRERVQ